MKCDRCQHMDYQGAVTGIHKPRSKDDHKMKFWGLCKIGNEWDFLGRISSCNKFQEADEETIEKRKQWLEQRG